MIRFADLLLNRGFKYNGVWYFKITPTVVRSVPLIIYNALEVINNADGQKGAWIGDDELVETE